MKEISTYISEKLKIDKSVNKYTYHPENQEELIFIIGKLIKARGRDANLNDIDVSGIDWMRKLFVTFGSDIRNIDISKWDVSNVRNMNQMFEGCNEFNCDLSKWDVGNVVEMKNMFHLCYKFDSDLSDWDVHKVQSMEGMFDRCESFNCDLSKWDVSSVYSMKYMFHECKEFEGIGLDKWKTNSLGYTERMFAYCKKFNADIINRNTDILYEMQYMFNKCENFNQDLNKWKLPRCQNMFDAFDGCKSLKKLPDWYHE